MKTSVSEKVHFTQWFIWVECALVLALALVKLRIVNDDAFITLRYAHNLIHGRGFVYNPGEHVFGLTNPLLALLQAATSAVCLGNVLSANYLVQYLLLLGSVLLFARWLNDRLVLAALIPLLFFNQQTVGYLGNEAVLLLFLSLLALNLLRSGRDKWFAFCLSLMYLARFDAVIFGAVATVWWLHVRRPWSPRKLAVHFMIWGSLPVAWHTFSFAYYGAFLSNSVTSELLGFAHGKPYISVLWERYLSPLTAPWALFQSGVIVAGLLAYWRHLRIYCVWFLCFSAVYWAIGAQGIKPWYFHTFTFVVIMAMACGLALVGRRLFGDAPAAHLFAAFVSLTFALGQMNDSWERQRYELYRKVADEVQRIGDAGAPLEMNEIGILGYYLMEHPVLDQHFLVTAQGKGPTRFPPVALLRQERKPQFLLINPYREFTEPELHQYEGYHPLGAMRSPNNEHRLYIFRRSTE